MSEENEVFLYIQAYLTKFKMMAVISIITSVLIIVGLGTAGLFAWKFIVVSEEKISKLEERLRTEEADIKTIISDKNLQISDMQTKLIALASIIDSLDKDRMKKTYDGMLALYSDFDKRIKEFENNANSNVNISNRNLKLQNDKIIELQSQINHIYEGLRIEDKAIKDIFALIKRY